MIVNSKLNIHEARIKKLDKKPPPWKLEGGVGWTKMEIKQWLALFQEVWA